MTTIPGFFEGTGMPDPAKVLQQIGLGAGMDVIDLCSGDGWFTVPISRVARHVFAIDIDERLLALARQRVAESTCGIACSS